MSVSFPLTDGARSAVVGVRLTPDERAELAELAQRRGRPLSELIRASVLEVLYTRRGEEGAA